MSATHDSAVGIALLFPDLLGTYGDSGNAVILAERLRWRGIDSEVVTVRSGEPVPAGCQLYLVGGGEDLPQALAARQMGAGTSGGPVHAAVDAGAVVLAVCAGLQILGRAFVGPDGTPAEGLGLIDCTTERGRGPRAVGEIVVDPNPELGLGALSGYENHGGVTTLGAGAAPLGRVRVGIGNGPVTAGPVTGGPVTGGPVTGGTATDGTATDGVWSGRVLGTYLHGPVLARNPDLADLLLSWAVGDLAPVDDREAEELRRERLDAAEGGAASRPRVRWWRRRAG